MVLRIVHHSLSLDDPTAVPGGKDRKHDTIVCGAGMENKRTSWRVELLMPEHVIKRELTATALEPARLIDPKAVWHLIARQLGVVPSVSGDHVIGDQGHISSVSTGRTSVMTPSSPGVYPALILVMTASSPKLVWSVVKCSDAS
ncbi:hypothetical protein [Nocardia sputorum]|uniref:hypothetical protein n=1 Tax=Nocardia sputorum TaxID=2984338 RepID=UPI002492E73D|nr:hypothetical protein [Nocardia sputorum]